jgi:hypothetical protein
MNIGLSILGWFQLNNEFNIWNVKTSSSNISGDQHLKFMVLESLDRDLSLILSDISMHDFNIMSDLVGKKQRVCISLGRRKDNNPASASIAIHYNQKAK